MLRKRKCFVFSYLNSFSMLLHEFGRLDHREDILAQGAKGILVGVLAQAAIGQRVVAETLL